jgi:hypothetical protein
MQAQCAVALKEWGVVCAGLATGRTIVLCRKGGIAEARGDFEVAHREFWLYPTRFHQSPSQLADGAADLLTHPLSQPPEAGWVELPLFAEVLGVAQIGDERLIEAIAAATVLSVETIRQRFHYREPGLHLLAVRIYSQTPAHLLPELARYVGCHSWVDLEGSLLTADVRALQSDSQWRNLWQRIPAEIQQQFGLVSARDDAPRADESPNC